MKRFMDEDFLLENETARHLYHTYVKDLPIIDYHCHLEAREIRENKRFRSITDIWLSGDHYKWRLMRANGIEESRVTGPASDKDKFDAWADTVPLLLGNPLYHWTHLELRRFFGIEDILGPETSDKVYERANRMLQTMPARTFIQMSNVETICTTNDPTDDLRDHGLIEADSEISFKVVPAFRPDKAIDIEKPWFKTWFSTFKDVVGRSLDTLPSYLEALESRIDFFHAHGARLADHALDTVPFVMTDDEDAARIYRDAIAGNPLSQHDIDAFKTWMLIRLGGFYAARGWVQQYHIGALRNINSKALAAMGPDTGYDAINDRSIAAPLSGLLDALDSRSALPKTILYTLNPSDFEVAITIMQAFQDGKIPGKIQFGSGWWFLDTIDGMEKQIRALANNGLLARFVGMLTDSRSFLSYSRHDYFRRIVCNIVGEEVERGRYPNDEQALKRIVTGVAYDNAKRYFRF
jgi:glucuronate isomerase